jgi:cob(I)alamin adenosyltransferase
MTDDTTSDSGESADSQQSTDDERHTDDRQAQAPEKGRTPEEREITPGAPEEFGLVQVWWGDGKGKTTAAMGMGFRAAGHGYRVHMLQFMKGGASSVEDVRGEYNAIAEMPGFTYENSGQYGWHGFLDESDDEEHEARAQGGLARARELVDASRDVDGALPLDGAAEDGVHLLILDEILYAANRGLVDPEDVISLVEDRPDALELVLTGSHEEPVYLTEHADLVTEVRKHKHPIDAGQRARKGTEY